MLRSIHPLQLLLTLVAGWINRRQLDAIDYLKEENRLLRERLGGRCLRSTDAERRRLARRAHALGRKVLSELDTLVMPDTLMRWYRTLVAPKWTYTHRRGPGRPRTIEAIVQLIVRMALDNPSWGYTKTTRPTPPTIASIVARSPAIFLFTPNREPRSFQSHLIITQYSIPVCSFGSEPRRRCTL